MIRPGAALVVACALGASALSAQSRPSRRPPAATRSSPTPPAAEALAPFSPGRVDTLRAVSALPVEIVGGFREPLGYQRLPTGESLVFDRRGHAVYTIDAARTAARRSWRSAAKRAG